MARELFYNPPPTLSPVRVIRVAPAGSKTSPKCPLCLQWRPNLRVATNRHHVPGRDIAPSSAHAGNPIVLSESCQRGTCRSPVF